MTSLMRGLVKPQLIRFSTCTPARLVRNHGKLQVMISRWTEMLQSHCREVPESAHSAPCSMHLPKSVNAYRETWAHRKIAIRDN